MDDFYQSTRMKDGADAVTPERPRRQNILIAVVTMPLVFLIVVMMSLALLGEPGGKDLQRNETSSVSASTDALAQPPLYGSAIDVSPASYAANPSEIGLEKDQKITALALDGARLALQVEGSGEEEIVIYDIGKGEIVQRIAVTATRVQFSAAPGDDNPIAEGLISEPINNGDAYGRSFVLKAPSLNPRQKKN